MKKKNYLWSMLAIMMVAVLSIGYISCGDDDDGDDLGGLGSTSVTGTWVGQDGDEQLTLIFKSGGTGTYIIKDRDSYSGSSTESGSFTYVPDGKNKGTIIVETYSSYYGKETDVFYYMIEGKTMLLYEDGYGDDLEWALTKQ